MNKTARRSVTVTVYVELGDEEEAKAMRDHIEAAVETAVCGADGHHESCPYDWTMGSKIEPFVPEQWAATERALIADSDIP
jgi:hypothetical protein